MILRRLIPADPIAASYSAFGAGFGLLAGCFFVAGVDWAAGLHAALGAVFLILGEAVRRLSRPGLWLDPAADGLTDFGREARSEERHP